MVDNLTLPLLGKFLPLVFLQDTHCPELWSIDVVNEAQIWRYAHKIYPQPPRENFFCVFATSTFSSLFAV